MTKGTKAQENAEEAEVKRPCLCKKSHLRTLGEEEPGLEERVKY
jgi:hypothetical protein